MASKLTTSWNNLRDLLTDFNMYYQFPCHLKCIVKVICMTTFLHNLLWRPRSVHVCDRDCWTTTVNTYLKGLYIRIIVYYLLLLPMCEAISAFVTICKDLTESSEPRWECQELWDNHGQSVWFITIIHITIEFVILKLKTWKWGKIKARFFLEICNCVSEGYLVTESLKHEAYPELLPLKCLSDLII